jgi:4-hydroxy-tetrahydrodipicolinate synthase
MASHAESTTQLTTASSGVFVISVTPFDADGALDLASTDKLVDFYLDKGVSGITLLGMMGEAPKLTFGESVAFVGRVVSRVAGRVPVVVGVSGAGFASMGELAYAAMDDGAAGVMIAPPPTVRSDDQIMAYFAGASQAIGPQTPWVLQDYPLSTQVVLSPGVIKRIVADNANCVMLKHEDWPGLSKISALRQAQADGDMRRVSILVGNGALFLPEEMGRGADGAMTGFGYPEMMVDIVKAYGVGHHAGKGTKADVEHARDLFDAYLPLARYEQQPGLGVAIRKHILAKRGAIKHATVRKPGSPLSALEIAEVETLIRRQTQRLQQIAG